MTPEKTVARVRAVRNQWMVEQRKLEASIAAARKAFDLDGAVRAIAWGSAYEELGRQIDVAMQDETAAACAHCGREMTPAAGYGTVEGRKVCHPSDSGELDCYRLVTVSGEQLGSRRPQTEEMDCEVPWHSARYVRGRLPDGRADCALCALDEANGKLEELRGQADRHRVEMDVAFGPGLYFEIQALLDQALGTREVDGAGAGIVAEVALLVERLQAVEADRDRYRMDWEILVERTLIASALLDLDEAPSDVEADLMAVRPELLRKILQGEIRGDEALSVYVPRLAEMEDRYAARVNRCTCDGDPIECCHEAARGQAEERVRQLTYERRLLGAARMVLDLVAEGDPGRSEELRGEAGRLAQRIVDEIGHPQTDEGALGPELREENAQLRQQVQLLAVAAQTDGLDAADAARRIAAAETERDALAVRLAAAEAQISRLQDPARGA